MIVLLLLIIFLKFSHYHLKKRFLTGIIICLILTGCSKNSASGDVVIDGTLNGQISLSKDEYVYYIDQNEDVVYREDNSNNTVAVTRNVFPLSGRITNIYLSEDKCYYQKESVIYKCPITGRKQYVIDENVSDGEIRYSNGILYYKDAYGE